jgi:hypothetical protein
MISGIGDYTALLSREFVNLGIQIAVLTSKCDNKNLKQFNEGVSLFYINSNWNFSSVKDIFKIIDKLGSETIIHIQHGCGGYNRHPMINLLPLFIKKRNPHYTVVVTLPEFTRELARLPYRIRTLPMLIIAHGLIFVDPADERHWIKSAFRYQNKANKALQKGMESGWVKLVGNVPADVVSYCLHASDIAAFPFTRGASPKRGSVLTAITHGIPTITARGPDTPKGFAERFGVEIVPAQNVEALSNRIKSIIASKNEKIKVKARIQVAAKQFSWTDIAKKTERSYS